MEFVNDFLNEAMKNHAVIEALDSRIESHSEQELLIIKNIGTEKIDEISEKILRKITNADKNGIEKMAMQIGTMLEADDNSDSKSVIFGLLSAFVIEKTKVSEEKQVVIFYGAIIKNHFRVQGNMAEVNRMFDALYKMISNAYKTWSMEDLIYAGLKK